MLRPNPSNGSMVNAEEAITSFLRPLYLLSQSSDMAQAIHRSFHYFFRLLWKEKVQGLSSDVDRRPVVAGT